MANWWDDAPIVQPPSQGGNWWDAAPVVDANAPNQPLVSEAKSLAASHGAVSGLPIVGPMIAGGVERAAALLRAPFTDKNYSEELQGIQNRVSQAVEQNPTAETVGNVVGGVVGTVPAVMAAPAAFGAGGGSLLARSAASALTGGGIAATDTGVRTGFDPAEMLKSGAWGVGLGGISPAVGQMVGKGVNALMNRVSGPSGTQAALGRAAIADNIPADDVAARLQQLGPNAMMADLGPNLQRQAGALASVPGEAQEIVRGAIRARDAGANQRIPGALDDSLGPAPIPSQIQAGIAENQQALVPEYAEALQNARPVNTEPLAQRLEQLAVTLRGEAQRGVQRVRQMLNVTGTDQLDPNPATLLQTRQAIDGLIETTTDPNALRALGEARRGVDNSLAASVPGIKLVDAKYAELARQNTAVQRGSQVLDSGRTAPRPVELAQEVQEGALPQGQQIGPSAVPFRLRQGARAEIDRIVGTNANDVVALHRIIKGEGDWNRARLATLFGDERADRILNVLQRERAFADTSQIVTRNSETAARTAAQKEIAGPEGQPGIVRSILNLRFGDAAADTGGKLIGGAQNAAQQSRNANLARLLTSGQDGGREATTAIRAIQAAQRRGDLSATQARQLIATLPAPVSQSR